MLIVFVEPDSHTQSAERLAPCSTNHTVMHAMTSYQQYATRLGSPHDDKSLCLGGENAQAVHPQGLIKWKSTFESQFTSYIRGYSNCLMPTPHPREKGIQPILWASLMLVAF